MHGYRRRNDMLIQFINHQPRHLLCILLTAESLVAGSRWNGGLMDDPVVTGKNVVGEGAIG